MVGDFILSKEENSIYQSLIIDFMNDKLKTNIKNIRFIATDFDGVWTNGKVLVDEDGSETVMCSRKDTLRIEEIKKLGIPIHVISRESNVVVSKRCEKMNVVCWQGIEDKVRFLGELLKKEGVKTEEVAYVGDDINDLACLKLVGVPMTVADGHPACKEVAVYVTKKSGGDHAMREIFDLILSSRTEATG